MLEWKERLKASSSGIRSYFPTEFSSFKRNQKERTMFIAGKIFCSNL